MTGDRYTGRVKNFPAGPDGPEKALLILVKRDESRFFATLQREPTKSPEKK